ncbi:MAG: filamentous hemagglutinin family protein [Proteobacteria bacterium]|nr:filamentous hemagglutinin family protein [Pseudomonadota bacterium]
MARRRRERISIATQAVTLLSCEALLAAPLQAAPPAPNQLPVVCVAGNCGAGGPTTWVSSGQATATAAANTLTIQQTSEQAILNWASFDVGQDGKVIFNQPNSSAIALNQIFKASPSQIFGTVKANGQIYLVNQNGIVFGSTATVNTGGLLASTLQLTSPLSAGLLSGIQSNMPALAASSTQAITPTPQITVQSGAQLTTNVDGGRIMLAAQNVTNGGTITAPDGQVILAAGQSVYIQASNDPSLRGLIVEVDAGGLAQNLASGSISVNEGNASLVGLAVNQQGRITANTSVSENGSINLLARDTVSIQTSQTGVLELVPSRGGKLTLGTGSRTEVLPDTTSTATAIDSQAQPQSTITLAGQTVELMNGSDVVAPGGHVSVTASSNPGTANSSVTPDPNAQLRIDSGATIDVSGSTASVSVTRNLVSVQLRGAELADDPLQRDGPLRGQTVIVDARVGTPLANVSGDLALIKRSVLERTDQGGTITLNSAGDVVVASGATLNVSGGAVNYTPGIMQTSLLTTPDGSVVDIGQASPNQAYTGVVNPQFESVSNNFGVIQFIPTPGIAHYDPGYVQGASAGTIQVMGSSLVLQGNFLGSATNGIYQRSGSGVASGGTFIVGTNTAANAAQPDYRAPAVELVNQVPTVVVAPGSPLPTDLPVQLSAGELISSGFTNLQINSNDRITVPTGVNLNLTPGGSLALQAPQIELDSSVKIPSGTISLNSVQSFSTALGPADGVFVGNNVALNVNGSWVNDTLVPIGDTPSGFALINAGKISLDQNVFGGTLALGSDVSFLATGGAQLTRSGTLTGGAGGTVAFVGSPGGTVAVGAGDTFAGFGVQGAAGGTFDLEVPRLEIVSGKGPWLGMQSVSSDPATAAYFQVNSGLFSQYGFSSFNLTADGPVVAAGASTDILTVAAGTDVNLTPQTLLLNSTYLGVASGTSLSTFSNATVEPAYMRGSEQLSLSAVSGGKVTSSQIGDLTVAKGAAFSGDPGSSFTFSSEANLTFDGSVTAASGSVVLKNVAPGTGLEVSPDVALTLGPQAQINVAGTVVYKPSDLGLLNGTVLPGGSVALTAVSGSVVTEAGSTINFSGTQGLLDLTTGLPGAPVSRQTVASAAGTLAFEAPQSISLLGAFHGNAGVGTTGRAAGGTLDVSLIAPGGATGTVTVQQAPLTTALAADSGDVVVSTAQLVASGVDALSLSASSLVTFEPGTTLALARSVTITSPAVGLDNGGVATISAPYLALGTANSGYAATSATTGTGTLSFKGQEIDLIGSLAIQGAEQTTFTSSGDIQLRGEQLDTSNVGSLEAAGLLTLSAARIVPTTEVNFTIGSSGGTTNTVQFTQNGTSAGVPLSVGGNLTVTADNIVQGGTVIAPFGQLTFSATDSLTFNPGSLTSVSGNGAVLPYGEVQNGTSWVYQVSPVQLVPTTVTAIPNRQITLTGGKVTLAAGSTVDVSGGGDLQAWSFTPGPGGTVDVLSNTATPGLYAVLPSLRGQSAPYDPMLWAGSNLAPNESIYISGGSGLAAGVYPLLPARYAMLPGAYLVSAVSGLQNLAPGTTVQAPNGYSIVSGYLTSGNTGIGQTQTSGFLIEPGSYTQQLGTYTSTLASAFFNPAGSSTAAPAPGTSPLPADAGTLIFAVQSQLDALGKVKGSGASGGDGATVEVAAPSIEIDPSVSSVATSSGTIHLAASVLDGWDAGRLWLGMQTNSGGGVAVTANSVHVTSAAALTAGEVALAANGTVTVDAGAAVTSTSASTSGSVAAASAAPSALTLGNGSSGAAILIVSDLDSWQVQRGGTANGASGMLSLAAGAQVATRGALTADAPGGGTLGDGALSGRGAQWFIGSRNLAFASEGSLAGGFAIDGSLVAAIQKASGVTFSSQSAISVNETVDLAAAPGAAPIGAINFITPGLSSGSGSSSATFAANVITLSSPSGTAAAVQPGQGTLSLSAREIDVGPGSMGLSGFGTTTLDASNRIVGTGTGSLTVSGDLALLAPVITSASDSQTQITASGALALAPSAQGIAPVNAALQSGGSLALSGNTISDSTLIDMPSGELSLVATQSLALNKGAGIQLSGLTPLNAFTGADGGTVLLSSGGNVTVAGGTSLAVAGGQGANSGSVHVLATGTADIEGQLTGSASGGTGSGSFYLQAGSLNNFAGLNQVLEQSGFHGTRSFEVGSGDLDLAQGTRITAQNVALTADAGAVSVAGTIDVSGTSGGGSIVLSAHNDVTLTSTGQLLAYSTTASARGGSIELASTAGSVALDPAAQVAANGASGSGTLLIRAPQASGGTDVSITSLPTDLSRVGTVILEPTISESLGTAPATTDFQSIESAVASYMTAASPGILSRLGVASAPNVVLRPYVDLTTQGDLTLSGVDFSSWRFGGQPADVSIRSTGNLTLTGTISDGFNTGGGFLDVQSSGGSARISLVAGANLASASSTAVVNGAAVDLTLQSGAIVRTGTGDLNLAAARDIVFHTGSSVYTGGVQGAPSNSSTDTGTPVSFATGGGNVNLNAGRDVLGASASEAVDQWNPRFQPSEAAIWGINFGQFRWNVGALGGGNVTVTAGRNIETLTAAVADSRTFAADGTTALNFGGGNLTVNAGGDVGSGLFYVGNGVGRINAGGALSSPLAGSTGLPLGTMLLAGDASYYLSAQRDVLLDGMVSQTALVPGSSSDYMLYFRYGQGSTLSVQSRGGSVTLQSNPFNESTYLGSNAAFNTDPGVFTSAPPTVELAAFGSDVIFKTGLQAQPSAVGQLAIYAAHDIQGNSYAIGMSDARLTDVPTADAPSNLTLISLPFGGTSYTQASLHQDDPHAVQIAAAQDIDAITFDVPKFASITAGGNITSLGFAGTNLNPSDVTVIRAGGTIGYLSTDTTQSLTLGGPGQFDIIAGKTIDLGLTSGIATYGNVLNPNLAYSSGASLNIIAGLGAPLGVSSTPSSGDFVSKIIGASTTYQALMVGYTEQVTGDAGLTFATATPLFRGLSLTQQLPLLEQVFFDELVLSGQEANQSPSLGFGRGYAAIDSLFPNSRASGTQYGGDLLLGFSRIYTLDGGAINLMVPGGNINVGLANPPATFSEYNIIRTPSQLGIVAVGTGDVNIYTYDSIEVNQSRVFTLGGGNISIWSTTGNIDAGNGAKTSISAPPPAVSVDANGNVTLDFSAAVAGSGIRTIQSLPDVAAGDVNLIAPVGFVNAGDAGIGSSGNINIAAQKVIGASNINFGGTATGVPPEVSGLGASLSGASAVASSATNASSNSVDTNAQANGAAPSAAAAIGWLDVFLEGFGEEVCKSSDLECLKRNQKTQ